MAISIPIVDNIFYGTPTEFTVRLSGELVGTAPASIVRIMNDDPNRGRAQFQSAAINTGEASGSERLTVTRIEGAESTLSVNYATSDGTGRAGVDYQSASGTLVFAAGEVSKVIDVTIINNTAVDSSRTFNVTLSGDFVATPAAAIVTIVNDDTPPPNKGGGGGGGRFDGLLLLALGTRPDSRRRTMLPVRCSKFQTRVRELTRTTIDAEDGR